MRRRVYQIYESDSDIEGMTYQNEQITTDTKKMSVGHEKYSVNQMKAVVETDTIDSAEKRKISQLETDCQELRKELLLLKEFSSKYNSPALTQAINPTTTSAAAELPINDIVKYDIPKRVATTHLASTREEYQRDNVSRPGSEVRRSLQSEVSDG